jgi:hypothetical protein
MAGCYLLLILKDPFACEKTGRSPGEIFLLEVKTVKGRGVNPPTRTSDVIAKHESTERMLRAFIAQEKIRC